jgi:hypothetical protein
VTDVRVEAVGTEDRQVSVLDVVASPLLAPEATPAAPAVATRELRLALVCYGGVSLAIYMHGITKELEKLVAASVAYERDQRSNPFDADDTAAGLLVGAEASRREDARPHPRGRRRRVGDVGRRDQRRVPRRRAGSEPVAGTVAVDVDGEGGHHPAARLGGTAVRCC